MRPFLTALLLSSIPVTPLQGTPEPFQPFPARAYRLVNGVAFDSSESTMYFALLTREVLAHRGRGDTAAAPVTNIYFSRRSTAGWSDPEPVPFSNTYADYEPALSMDGNVMLFNSKRPHSDGRTPTRNDIFMVERRNGSWGTPRSLGINSFTLEESYPTIDSARRVVYVRGPVVEGGDDFDLYEFTLQADGTTSDPLPLAFSGAEFGEGDPQLALDGSFVIFTRWDHRVGWQQTCDLYLSFRAPAGWTIPVPLLELNTPQPDYAPALSPDGRTLYYRAGGRYMRRPLGPVLDSARARTQ